MVKPDSSKRTSDQTRDQLVAAATRLFSKQGYHGTSVKEIADAAGVNISLVSYHFGGKENLYKACLEPFVEMNVDFLEKKILRPTSKEDFKLRLRLFLEHMIQNELNNADACCIVRRDVELDDPILQDIFKKTVLRLFETVIGFIQSGQKDGYLRKDHDARFITVQFIGGIIHALRVDKMRKKVFGESLADIKVRERTIEVALDMLFNGFGT